MLNLPAGIGRTHWPLYVLVGLVEIVVMYLVFRFLIVKMNLKTPGREDEDDEEAEKKVELCGLNEHTT